LGDAARLAEVKFDEFGNAVIHEIGNLPNEIRGPSLSGFVGFGAESGDLLGRAAYDALIEPQRYLLGLPASLSSGPAGLAATNIGRIGNLAYDTFVKPQVDFANILAGGGGTPGKVTRAVIGEALSKGNNYLQALGKGIGLGNDAIRVVRPYFDPDPEFNLQQRQTISSVRSVGNAISTVAG